MNSSGAGCPVLDESGCQHDADHPRLDKGVKSDKGIHLEGLRSRYRMILRFGTINRVLMIGFHGRRCNLYGRNNLSAIIAQLPTKSTFPSLQAVKVPES